MDPSVFSDLNYLAILVSAVAYWLIGAVWYSPILFGKKWGNIIQPSEEAKKKMGISMVFSFIGFFLICVVMALFVTHLVPADITRGVKIALAASVGFMFLPKWINSLYANTSTTVLLIDAGYHIVGFVVAAIILTSWT